MGTYSVEFGTEHGTHSIHDGLTFDEVVDVVDEVTFETRGLRVEVTNKDSDDGELTADETEAVKAATNTGRRGMR